jgi:hypothetical protein
MEYVIYGTGRPSGLAMALLCLALLTQSGCSPQASQDGQNRLQESPPPSGPVRGEVPPDLLEKITRTLSEEENLDPASITVIRAESVIWPDGSLGCPRPGEMYTMAQVEGYWVVLESGDRKYDYRVSSTGLFQRCLNPLRRQNPVG